MKRVHYIDNYLINPQHPVTVNLIGAGGTGSQVLTCLARLDTALRGLGHPGLFITVYDSDIVTEANIGRQLFSPSDIGLNKAQCLVTRMNNFFGNDWKAVPDIYPAALKDARRDNLANMTITCTDNIKSRLDLWNILKAVPVSEYRSHETPLYWMDFGNTQDTGQVILGTVPKKIRQPESKLYETVESLKVITRYVKYARVKEKGLRTELLAGGGPGKAGPVHQLHAGSARLQHPVENVPQRHDRASRAVPEPLHHEGESYRGVTISCPDYIYSILFPLWSM